jgi:hypothetical protein
VQVGKSSKYRTIEEREDRSEEGTHIVKYEQNEGMVNFH